MSVFFTTWLGPRYSIFKATKEVAEKGFIDEGKSKAEASKEATRIALQAVDVTGKKVTIWERIKFWSPIALLVLLVWRLKKVIK